MITEPLVNNATRSAELTVPEFLISVESPAEFRSERHDTPPRPVDWDSVDARRYGLFP